MFSINLKLFALQFVGKTRWKVPLRYTLCSLLLWKGERFSAYIQTSLTSANPNTWCHLSSIKDTHADVKFVVVKPETNDLLSNVDWPSTTSRRKQLLIQQNVLTFQTVFLNVISKSPFWTFQTKSNSIFWPVQLVNLLRQFFIFRTDMNGHLNRQFKYISEQKLTLFEILEEIWLLLMITSSEFPLNSNLWI